MSRVVVVGGGITGLATALDLRDAATAARRELEIVVLEARSRPGGNVRTERAQGYIIERGPNGFLDNAPQTLDLVRRIGLEDRVQRADEAAGRRFIYRDGRLHQAPADPIAFLRTPLLSLRGRFRVLAEPFARPRTPGLDETVHSFATRRIGEEAASVLVDPMVSGVFAGDARALSLRSSFPRMAAMEEEHGSLVKAMVARMKERKAAQRKGGERRERPGDIEAVSRAGGPTGPGGTLTSFRDGLDTLVERLVGALGAGVVRTEGRVSAIEPGSRWLVRLESGETVTADAVVLTIPSPRAAPLLEPVDGELAAAVGGIPTAGLAVVATAFDAAAIPEVNGFGFLVPRGQGLRILGCLWDSSIFPGRAPDGKVLLRSMVGGAHDAAAVSDSEEVVLAAVRRDLRVAMRIEAEPELTRVYRWPLGIAQYHVGHQDRIDRIHDRLRAHPGLWVAGSSYYGVSMNACIGKAAEQAVEILRALE